MALEIYGRLLYYITPEKIAYRSLSIWAVKFCSMWLVNKLSLMFNKKRR
nr:hypothetical protein [Mucilaginibacter sp. SP1R1]